MITLTTAINPANSLFDLTPSARRVEENIISIKSKVKQTAALSPQPADQGLKSLFGKQATPEQAKDLLNFWEIGQKHFEAYIKYYMWQSRVEIEHYSVTYFDRITAFKAL